MSDTALIDSIRPLVELACRMDESALEKPWVWGSYDGEGLRFVFFRALEELRSLAVRLAHSRETGQAPTQAQHILAQYHAAYRDYEAALIGLDEAGLTQPPAEGEWPVQHTMAHILGADMGFYVVVRYALQRRRSGGELPERFGDPIYDAYLNIDDARLAELMARPAEDLLAYHADLHRRILAEFSQIGEDEIDLPSYYWEDEAYPLRFRLGRFESHLRQHTIQIDKTRAAIGRLPNEPLRLVRMVYAALAEAEGACLGAQDSGVELIAETAGKLTAELREIGR